MAATSSGGPGAAGGEKGTRGVKAVFLDRDGVINVRLPDGRYVTRWEEFRFLDGAAEALALLAGAGYLLVVVTNQRGVGRGLMSEGDLAEIHRRMSEELAARGAVLAGVLHCPHDLEARCRCRKPGPGMIEEAVARFDIDPASSVIVGDSPRDIEAGRAAGVAGIFVAAGGEDAPPGCPSVPSLLEAARMITAADRGGGEGEGP